MGKRLRLRVLSDALPGSGEQGKPGRNRAQSPVNPGAPPPGMRCFLEGPPLGPVWEDSTWPDQGAPWGRKASSTREIKPQISNVLLPPLFFWGGGVCLLVFCLPWAQARTGRHLVWLTR